MPRRTLESEVELVGVGLHTGAQVTTRCCPGSVGKGIVFRRTDLPDRPWIPARLDWVGATARRTQLRRNGVTLDTVEHLLAAVAAEQLDDLMVEVNGPELPILDGSFQPWIDSLGAGGRREHAGEPDRLRLEESVHFRDGDSEYRAVPANSALLSVTIEWPHPSIGRQSAELELTADSFRREIAGARTFAEGGYTGMRGRAARRSVEPGRPALAQRIRPPQTGGPCGRPHATGRQTARANRGHPAQSPRQRGVRRGNCAPDSTRRDTVMDIRAILDLLPHRYPFLLVDRILEMQGTEKIVGLKNVTINEPFFQGHFPGHPVMPGVLIVEAMAQTGGLLLMEKITDRDKKVVYFMSLDNVKFRRPVVPGDQLRMEVEMLQFRGKTCRMKGIAYVDGKVAAEAEMMAGVVDK
jgi:UDP-3-O-[3-hydroxymyristoyl] N-acetylglucosamine deacetylase/3-hydroxyacyl-[acyl-carrier-protein] dehydratase